MYARVMGCVGDNTTSAATFLDALANLLVTFAVNFGHFGSITLVASLMLPLWRQNSWTLQQINWLLQQHNRCVM